MFRYIILWISFFSALKGIGKAHIMGIVSKKRAHIMSSSRISSTDVQSHHRIYHAHYFHPMRIIVLYHCTISFHSVLYMDCGVEYWIGFQNYCCVLSGDDLGWCSYKVTTMATAQQASCWPCLVVFRKQFYPCTARQRSPWEFIRCAVPGHLVCAGRNWLMIHGWDETPCSNGKESTRDREI